MDDAHKHVGGFRVTLRKLVSTLLHGNAVFDNRHIRAQGKQRGATWTTRPRGPWERVDVLVFEVTRTLGQAMRSSAGFLQGARHNLSDKEPLDRKGTDGGLP